MNDDSPSGGKRIPATAPLAVEATSYGTTGNNGQSVASVAAKTPPLSTTSTRPKSSSAKSNPGGSWRRTFSSLSNRNFLYLWLGMLTVMAGMQMQMLARGYLVYDITGSASLLGVVNAGTAIPMLVLSLFGGAFADRFDRKRIIQFGQVMVAGLALLIGLVILSGYITWYYLMIASMIQGAVWAFMMPARQAIIPQLVGPENLSNAMALNAAAMSAMTLVAPAVAGGLYAFAGPHNVYFVIAVLALLAVVFTSLLPKSVSASSRARGPMTAEIIAGIQYIRGSPIVLVLLVMGLSTTLLAMPFRFLLPVFVVDIYSLGPDYMGLLVAVMGGGSLVGALFIAAIDHWRRGMLLMIGSMLSGVALLMISAFPFYIAAVFIMIPLGLGDAGRRTLNQSLIMEEVEDQYRGRVMSVFMLNFGLMPLGVLPTAVMIDIFGARIVVAVLGMLLMIFTTVLILTQKRLREMQ